MVYWVRAWVTTVVALVSGGWVWVRVGDFFVHYLGNFGGWLYLAMNVSAILVIGMWFGARSREVD